VTCGGVGLLKPLPGTCASLVAVLIYVLMVALTGAWMWIVIPALVVAFLGPWLGSVYERQVGRTDPPEFVLDECLGMWIAMAGKLPWGAVLASFLLFRFFDIVKPFPIRRLGRLEAASASWRTTSPRVSSRTF